MLVLDANILVRAVLGRRVRNLLAAYSGSARFLVPDAVVSEAGEHLPAILARRGLDPAPAIAVLDQILGWLDIIGVETYGIEESRARERVIGRDSEDWPVVAIALMIGCPIWTEDADFFGCGIATWTTERVEIYLRSLQAAQAAKA
jgi:predicted nucleic acid-binding protein